MSYPATNYSPQPPGGVNYGFSQAPVPTKVPGRVAGIFAILFFWTGSIGCALGYVSISQARRANAPATLGIIGFVLGLAVFIGIFFYVLFGVMDVWKLL